MQYGVVLAVKGVLVAKRLESVFDDEQVFDCVSGVLWAKLLLASSPF
jgi:hypothetical protein